MQEGLALECAGVTSSICGISGVPQCFVDVCGRCRRVRRRRGRGGVASEAQLRAVREGFEDVVWNNVIRSEKNLADILATRFGVSGQAMLFRLINLGLVVAP